MADNMTPIDAQSAEDAYEAGPAKGSGKFGASRTSKIVIGAVLLILVLAVAAGAFFVFFGGSSSSEDVAPVAPAGANTAAAQTTSTAAPTAEGVAAVEPAPIPLTDVFTFRDIFEPLVKAPKTSTTTSGTPSGGTGTGTSANTILLQDITSENGVPQAVLVWNGTTYTVGEGEQVGTSPWKVLEIQTDSVIMLYGDVQVPLSVGQAITK